MTAKRKHTKTASVRAVALWGVGMTIALSLMGCGRSGGVEENSEGAQETYSAEIRRTSFGIPHVLASDHAGLGYGIGYAYAQDNVCMFAEMIVTANGERSRHFDPDAIGGPDVVTGSISSSNLQSDFFFKYLNAAPRVQDAWNAQKPDAQALLQGYAAGYNRYLADTGRDRLPKECRNADWVRDITELDLIRLIRRMSTEAGSLRFMPALVAAQPPAPQAATPTAAARADQLAFDLLEWRARKLQVGSNGVALGKQATENRRGLLLGNPHYPWFGTMRFYQVHLTIPGELDVMGASIGGLPMVAIGFNRHVAWTHTVNTSEHFTLYALQLDPADPTQYVVDGKTRPMIRQTVIVDAKDKDGSIVQRTHDFWITDFGPIIELPGQLDWHSHVAYALRDANLDNYRMLEVWSAMNRAQSLDQLQQAITDIVGIPWVNTVATDETGGTLYANVTVVPNVPQAKQAACIAEPYAPLAQQGIFVLSASAQCEWDIDPAAPQPGIFAGKDLPVLRRTDYVQNSNDSAWMTNPAEPLVGFAPIISLQDYPQGDRTRIGITQIQARLAGTDGLPGNRFNADNLASIAFNNRVYYASVMRDDLLKVCADTSPVMLDKQRVDIKDACAVFKNWDGHANLGSTGYPLATAWIAALVENGDAWTVPFSAKDPVNTPRGIKHDDPKVKQIVRAALAGAVLKMREAGIDASQPWGEIQGVTLNGKRIPIHGGLDVYNAMGGTTRSGGQAPVEYGSSYIQIVEFGENGPQVKGFLAYSQSTDPASAHFADQAPKFSALEWIPLPYTEAQIKADPNYTSLSISQ